MSRAGEYICFFYEEKSLFDLSRIQYDPTGNIFETRKLIIIKHVIPVLYFKLEILFVAQHQKFA